MVSNIVMEFFRANGYGSYIWPCYAFLFLLIILQLTFSIRENFVVRQKILHSLQDGNSSEKQTKN